jgi:flagellar motor protein MotB
MQQLNQVGDILAKYPRGPHHGHRPYGLHRFRHHNQILSEQRAQRSRPALSRGVAAASISTVGMGPFQPIASNTTASGRASNRRVEMKITIPQ